MPKRQSKRHTNRESEFYNGFSIGKTLMRLSIEFALLRHKKQQTIEEFADGCGVKAKFIKGIEAADIFTFMNADLFDFTKVAQYADVALAVNFTSFKETLKSKFEGIPKSWEEEFGSAREHQPGEHDVSQ